MTAVAEVMRVLEEVIDPELGLDVVSLGMIRDVSVDAGRVTVGMTLTTATCPFWQLFVDQVRIAVLAIPEATDVEVNYIENPPWHPDAMSEEARRVLDGQGILPIFGMRT